jgi:hypothetical protein
MPEIETGIQAALGSECTFFNGGAEWETGGVMSEMISKGAQLTSD